MEFSAVTRGRMRCVAGPDIALYGCRVTRAPYVQNGKTYVAFDAAQAEGDVGALARLDAFVRSQTPVAYSPVSGTAVVAKITRSTRYETATGSEGWRFDMAPGDAIDVVLHAGAFGPFGYFVTVARVKPHARAEAANMSRE